VQLALESLISWNIVRKKYRMWPWNPLVALVVLINQCCSISQAKWSYVVVHVRIGKKLRMQINYSLKSEEKYREKICIASKLSENNCRPERQMYGEPSTPLRGWEPSGATPSAGDALDRDSTPQIILSKYIDEFNNYKLTLFCLNCLLMSFYLWFSINTN
jgi:hypothetical protein